MRSLAARAALLLFGSGFCALVYQTAWLRSLRLVFGASTAASAAVLAIFMAGLGFGSLLLGPRADRKARPLGFYSYLEGGIAAAAGLSPWLIELVRGLYLAAGGSARLGLSGGTLVRLLLAALVLGVPTFLMGGTLPAVARAVERSADRGRRLVGTLYAANTLGAVVGVLATTFFSLEVLGTRKTIWVAALLNLLVALVARRLSLALPAMTPGDAGGEAAAAAGVAPAAAEASEHREVPEAPAAPPATQGIAAATGEAPRRAGIRWLVPAAAALVGFAFLLMELVWYRMLAPVLGGSSYTFGLILAVALLGIGLGGWLYGVQPRRRRPTLTGFAATCALEALLLALPFALGDRIAVLAALLRPSASAGFAALVLVWTAITAAVVLPAAYVAGYQFPLLIGLLGSGRRRVGREVGTTYAANTVGAVAGSIAGGFGLLPLLSAPGVWRLVVVTLAALAVAALAADLRLAVPAGAAGLAPSRRSLRPAALPLLLAALALACCAATGPTAFWRHSAIGAGRLKASWDGPNDVRRTLHDQRQAVVWEVDGVESSVALVGDAEYAFLINGKSDGSARGDAATQVMSGLVGTMLHPAPRRSLVIGLGTGSTAGWMAAVPGMERVDVVELEPAVVEVARACVTVNHGVLANPKVRLTIGDGRELLLTTRERYDVIFSEPSNPYRAGIASLFTEDFYRAAAERLAPGGVFIQWLQGYEVDAQAVRTVYATLSAVFPAVESWRASEADLLLLATKEPIVHDAARVRARAAGEPYASALDLTWGVAGAEGFYSGFLATPALARALSAGEDRLNTDDRPVLEFGFARALGRSGLFKIDQLQDLARDLRLDRPLLSTGAAGAAGRLDWRLLEELRASRIGFFEVVPARPDPGTEAGSAARQLARRAYASGELTQACEAWRRQEEAPVAHFDRLLLAECSAAAGDPRAPEYAAALARHQPMEAQMALAAWHQAGGRPAEAGRSLLAAFRRLERDPWIFRPAGQRALQLAIPVSRLEPRLGQALYAQLGRSFAANLFDFTRKQVRMEVARAIGRRELCTESIAVFEPHVPWERGFLAYRAGCYRDRGHPLADRAASDLGAFLADAPPELTDRPLAPAGNGRPGTGR